MEGWQYPEKTTPRQLRDDPAMADFPIAVLPRSSVDSEMTLRSWPSARISRRQPCHPMRCLLLLPLLLACVVCEPIVIQGRGSPSPAYQEAPPSAYPPAPPPEAYPPAPASRVMLNDDAIVVVFADVFDREPSRDELRSYGDRARSHGWGAGELGAELRRSDEFRRLNPEYCIRRIWRELLNGEPDDRSLRYYQRCMIDQGWTPGQVRRAIQESDEYRGRRADLVIERAFRELLDRAPDPAGREHYRRLIRQGYTDEQVRAAIRQSVEYRVDLPDSKTKRAYQNVLGREADPSGIESYRKKLVDRGWTEKDVENDLRRSPEFRDRSFEDIIRRVYREVLGREPDPDSLARYSRQMREQGLTEAQLRAQLRPAGGTQPRRHDNPGGH
jgi:SOS response regulatory protein OraA/RecX